MIVGDPSRSGADLAVALVNTWDTYDEPPEHLTDVDALQRFLRRVGREESAQVAGERDLAEVRRLRERLREVFTADDVPAAVGLLNALADETAAIPRLEPSDGGWRLVFGPGQRSVAAHLGASTSAALLEIVRAHGLARFGTCSAPPCTGAFVDRTKNRSKRYCCELCADRAAQERLRARRR